MTTRPATKTTASSTDQALTAKWSKRVLAAGFTALPDVLIHSQQALKLKPLDVLILLHLASYWWQSGRNPWPAKGKLADELGVDARTVQRHIARMEEQGYVRRIERRASAGDNLTNEYDLSGLVAKLGPLADAEVQKREQRAAEDKSRRATPAAYALRSIAGGKVSP